MLRLVIWRWLLRALYYTPLFRSACASCGKNLRLIDGYPFIGSGLEVHIGNNVRIYGSAGFGGYKVFEAPKLIIGDNTFIGPEVRMGVGKEIRIGKNCLIAARVFVADHDGHPVDAEKRRQGLPEEKDDIRPIAIKDDAWLGEGAFVCKGVTIGEGAIVAARSVVTRDVEPFTIVAGNPAKLVRKIGEAA